MTKQKQASLSSSVDSIKMRWIDEHYGIIFRFIVIGAGLIYVCLQPLFQIGFFNDDAVYVLVARKLWHASAAYPHLGIKADYPLPGLPLLLSPFAHFVKPHWILLDWLSIISTLVSIIILEKWIRRWLSAGEALVALALYAFNPIVAQFSGILMPASYYSLFVIVSFFLLERLLRSPSVLRALGLGFVLGWASLMRPEGILVAASVVGVFLISRNKNKRLALPLMIPLLAWGLFFIFWAHSQRSSASEFGGDARSLLAYWSGNPLEGAKFILEIPKEFLFGTWGSMLRRLPFDMATFIALTFIFLCVMGMYIGFRSSWANETQRRVVLASAVTFCCAFFWVHVFWHVALPRYCVPLFPFVVIAAVRGWNIFLKKFPEKWIWGSIFICILFLSYGCENAHSIYQALNPQSREAPPWRTLAWIKSHMSRSANITSNIGPGIELYTGRHARRGFDATNADLYLYFLMRYRIDFVVHQNLEAVTPGVPGAADPNIRYARRSRWLRMYPDRFHAVFGDAAEGVQICRIDFNQKYSDAFEKFIAAIEAFNTGRYDSAFQDANESLNLYPKLGCAHNLLGVLYLFQDQTKKAESEFLTARTLLPDSTFEALNLATLYERRGLRAVALDYLDKGDKISALNGEHSSYAANVHSLEKKWETGRATLFVDSPNPAIFDEDSL